MTPDELLQGLRDIQLPEAPHEAAPFAFAIEPLLVLALAIALLLAASLWRRRIWRWQLETRLREIDRETKIESQWTQLLDLIGQMRGIARLGPPPGCVYRPLDRVGSEEIDAVRRYLRTASQK